MFKVGIVTIFLLIIFAPSIFFHLTLQRTLQRVKPKNRKLPPGQVWLNFIPLFGLVWQFIVVERISNSLKLELDEREIPYKGKRPAYDIGIAYCVLFVASVLPLVGVLTSIGGLVCWIVYWLEVNKYKKLIPIDYSGQDILDSPLS